MKVLITGAAGVLGMAMTGLLQREDGVRLRLTDVMPLETRHEFQAADLAKPEELKSLCDGVDVLFHIAAIHPWKPYTTEQYIRCNIEGTYNILQAAAAGGMRRVIYTSSVAAMGMGWNDSVPLPWDESKPCDLDPGDIYGFSKHVGEEACRALARQGKFTYVILRPGTFIPAPEDDPRFGLGLLSFTVHATDVAMAHLLAFRSNVANDAFVITSKTTFTREDGPELPKRADAVILRRYPRARLLVDQGVTLPAAIRCTYDIGKARRLLGYEPRYTFESWLEKRFRHES
jgi:nucleoside-diphosphate-sugar epimerase